MRHVLLAVLVGGLLFSTASASLAQGDGPVFYMTQYNVPQARIDSLVALTQTYDIPWHGIVADNVEGYQRWYMRHDTGNEYNFLTVTMYPDWDMVRGDEIPFDDFAPQMAEAMGMTMEEMEAEDDMVNEAFSWAYDGSQHVDQIWRPIARTGSDDEEGEMNPDMVAYMTQHKIMQSRVDSLASLTQEWDARWHDFVADNVEGYGRYWMRHDTGNEYNFMIITTYPSWDMVDSVPYDELFPQWLESMDMTEEEFEAMNMEEKFNWVYEGAEHIDQIWRPIVPGDM